MAYPAETSSDANASEGSARQRRWVLKFGDKVYGPYSFEAMKTYVAEGRVAEHSLLAPEGTPAGAAIWQHAVTIPAFAELLRSTAEETGYANETDSGTPTTSNAAGAAEMDDGIGDTGAADVPARQPDASPEARVSHEIAIRQPAPAAEDGQRPAYGSGKGQTDRRRQPDSANFLIVMDIKARFAGPLEQAIMSLGPAYKLAPNVWCVNADATAAGLLNDLSQHIGRTDTMFIADTTRDRTAWSSMGPEVDAKIRRVWRRTY